MEWAQNVDGSDNDYLFNINKLANRSTVYPKRFGYVCSILPSYLRNQEKLVVAKTRAEELAAKSNEWCGEIKKREDFELILIKVHCIEGAYGTTYIHKFEDAAGNDFTWFASVDNDLNRGEKVTLKATVKKHDTYNDRKQTIITRAKVLKREAMEGTE